MIVGRTRTKGFRQTELSKLLSPPVKWSYGKLLLWSGLFSVAALIAYVNYAMASPPPVSVLPVEIYSVLFSGVFVFLLMLFWRHNHSSYQQDYAEWNRSFICSRCGAISEFSNEKTFV